MVIGKKTILMWIFLSAFFIVAGCIHDGTGQSGTGPVPTPSPVITGTSSDTVTKEELVAFVNEAVEYAKTHGKEKALAEFSNPNGSFVKGELYIYAYDFNGTTIAHPVNPEKIGVNRLNERDAKGNLFITELRDTALNGSGFVQYYYINPVHNNTIEPKLGYVMKVDNTWWLGSGIYGDLDSIN